MKVTIYSGEGCPPCTQAKRYLKEKGIDYEEVDLTKDENNGIANKLINETGEFRIPIIDIDGDKISGFNKEKLDSIFNK